MRVKFVGGPRNGEAAEDVDEYILPRFGIMKLEAYYQNCDGKISHKLVRHLYELQGNRYVYQGKEDA